MRNLKFALGVLLLAGIAATGLSFANEPMPEESGASYCGAWEWISVTTSRRMCYDGSLYWYQYMTVKH
jgi:hypothetical protein